MKLVHEKINGCFAGGSAQFKRLCLVNEPWQGIELIEYFNAKSDILNWRRKKAKETEIVLVEVESLEKAVEIAFKFGRRAAMTEVNAMLKSIKEEAGDF